MRPTGLFACCLVVFLMMALPASVAALPQDPPPPPPAQEPERSDPDVIVDPMQPEFNLLALPTTLRMPAGKWAFRITHRFTREIGEGNIGDFVSDLFGIDEGTQTGLEIRVGLPWGTQLGVHRTNDRTIQFFARKNLLAQRDEQRVGIDLLATFEGWENLSEHYQSALGVILSRGLGTGAVVYLEPIVAFNSNPVSLGDQHTFVLGLGGRIRLGRTTYLMTEWAPRLTGYSPLADQLMLAFEKRAGGHLFQINVGNGLSTTIGQLASGTADYERWYLGMAIARKLF